MNDKRTASARRWCRWCIRPAIIVQKSHIALRKVGKVCTRYDATPDAMDALRIVNTKARSPSALASRKATLISPWSMAINHKRCA